MVRAFTYWGGSGESLPVSQKFANSPPPRKITSVGSSLSNFYYSPPPHHQKSIPPLTKQQFSGDNPILNSIFSCSHCSCSIFVLISYSLEKQFMLILILIDVQYLQKAIFSFEKDSNPQNYCSSGSLHPEKKFLQ